MQAERQEWWTGRRFRQTGKNDVTQKEHLKMVYLNIASYHQPKKNLKDILRTWELVFLVFCEMLTKPLGYMYLGASEHVGMRACVNTIPTPISSLFLILLTVEPFRESHYFFSFKGFKSFSQIDGRLFVPKRRCSTDFIKGIETQNKEGQEGPLQVTSLSTQDSG